MQTNKQGRNVVVTMFLSLDGVMESPENWNKKFHNAEAQEIKHEELFASDALLLGRRTWEIFAGAWPTRSDEAGFADRMNSIQKYVVSSSMSRADWNNTTILADNPFEQIADLKAQTGGDLLVCGSRSLVHGLFQHKLVDELRFLMDPIILARGKRLLPVPGVHLDLGLLQSRRLETGSILGRYAIRSQSRLEAA